MIENVKADGLKGLPKFEQPLKRLNLFVGQNGSGKSARADALKLAVLGYVPGTAKTNQEILSSFGSSEKLFVEIAANNKTTFLRRFAKENDSVSHDCLVNHRKATKEKYAASLVEAGNPRILDLSAFMSLSDQKKIDTIFSLFPPDGDFIQLDSKIEDLKSKQNNMQTEIKETNRTIGQLNQARTEINLPSGTLGEIKAEIEKTEIELKEAKKALEEARIEIAREEAKAKAEKEALEKAAMEKAKHESELKKAEEKAKAQQPIPFVSTVIPESITNTNCNVTLSAISSLEFIIEALKASECTACAALLIAKRELKKHQNQLQSQKQLERRTANG
ncbi:MAG: hypothetical protein HQK79_20640 [Desulfobacterales bacterium]|nr:hypothetical protein [Desulfobacterales bacterium]